jgi:hypothetical protein
VIAPPIALLAAALVLGAAAGFGVSLSPSSGAPASPDAREAERGHQHARARRDLPVAARRRAIASPR